MRGRLGVGGVKAGLRPIRLEAQRPALGIIERHQHIHGRPAQLAAALDAQHAHGGAVVVTVHDLAVLREPGWFNRWTRSYSRLAVPDRKSVV